MSAPTTTFPGRETRTMSDLAKYAIDAHGGLDRWRQLKTVSAHLRQGGALWRLKGQEGALKDVRVTVGLRSEWTSAFAIPSGEATLVLYTRPNRH